MSRNPNRRTPSDNSVPDSYIALVIVYKGEDDANFREYLAYMEEHAADIAQGPGKILAKVYGREDGSGAVQLMEELAAELTHAYTFTLEEHDGNMPVVTLR